MGISQEAALKQLEKLPHLLLNKIQIHWSKLLKAFRAFDRDGTGVVKRKDFQAMCFRNGIDVDDREVDRLAGLFSTPDNDLDFAHFREVMAKSMQPAEVQGGCSLPIKPSTFKNKRPEGRSRTFQGLKSTWNNAYSQALDTDGKPSVSNVIEGRYYMEGHNVFGETSMTTTRYGLVMDESMNQPLVKSLLQGEYYLKRGVNRPESAKVDYIAHNRKMTRDYSRLVSSTRPPSSLSMSDRGAGTAMGYVPQMAATVTRPSRARLVGQMPTPRTSEDLQEIWGRALDPRFAATTLAWLGKANDMEKTQFKNAVFKYPSQIVARPGLLASSRSGNTSRTAYRAPRPASAPPDRDHAPLRISSAQGGEQARAEGGGDGEQPDEQASERGGRARFSLSGRPVTPQVEHNALAAATAYRRNRPALSSRPSSAPRSVSSQGRPMGKAAPMHVLSERSPEIHSTIQKSAFGASWAAPAAPLA
mmetsp:Transcript_42292/g.96337  ORF Transcript_42292/g.96337 Transcript_42292/m.96337 type:complete len:474 (+) Transcript_42292:78-1499(+)